MAERVDCCPCSGDRVAGPGATGGNTNGIGGKGVALGGVCQRASKMRVARVWPLTASRVHCESAS